MNRLSLFFFFCMAPLVALSADKTGRDTRIVFVQMGIEESFIVHLKPQWRVFRRRAVDLCFEDFLIKGPKNSFNLSMQFCYEDPDLLQYDTPEKQRRALTELTASLYDESYEKAQGKPRFFRDFAPAGRCGCALRLTSNRWVGKMPPPEEPEGKFVTCGLFRIGANSALFFQLWTNSVDDAAYRELLDMIVDLCKPEFGEPDWELSTAGRAAEAAKTVLYKFHPEALDEQCPFSVHRRGEVWIVSGGRWTADHSEVNEVALHGPTGRVIGVSAVEWPLRPVGEGSGVSVKR